MIGNVGILTTVCFHTNKEAVNSMMALFVLKGRTQ